MTEAITMIQTQRSATGSGLLHPHHSVLKQIKPFSRDSQTLKASTCCYMLFCSVLLCVLNGGYAYTGNAASSTSCSGKMSKDVGMGVRKGTVVSFVPTLYGCFLGIPSLYVCSFF